ncbi:phosphatase PAP2 family protein [Solicola gregarius]|uniref:Phosphatase PAP2 family protein n=1 Tax=Solicola gregarius TaxID=2908642 RepID=A0AA46YL33_9ACTN|nr:phosphatase PAP2 family protein [Solicola gregarius]UYM05126.1 phosphatase PAP2 family protein [Solicola gregarius]
MLVAWVYLIGVPTDAVQIFAWLWLATIAWNIDAPWRSHLQFVKDWWIPLVILLLYLYSRGLSDDLRTVVHITEPIKFDEWIGGGTTPTEHLQSALCGNPCTFAVDPHWYDVALTAVYYSHFLVAPAIAVVLWIHSRAAWLPFMRRYIAINLGALVVYVAYPMAPPWMASEQGYLSSSTPRLTGHGWSDIGMDGFHFALASIGNPVAAMPSLHAGLAAMVAFYGVLRLRSRWRWLLLLYPAAMSFMLVYYAEHYVIDVLAGYVLAGVVLAACSGWERRRTRPEPVDEKERVRVGAQRTPMELEDS